MRLLYDELLPWRVAVALRALEFRVSHVGHEGDGAPPRGSEDEVVLDFARKTRQVIVTSNHDMILLCASERASVVWLDPRGRKLRWEDHVVLAFENIATWDQMLRDAKEPMCVRVLRTRNEVLSLERAAHLVDQRMRSIRARERSRRKASPSGDGGLFAEDP